MNKRIWPFIIVLAMVFVLIKVQGWSSAELGTTTGADEWTERGPYISAPGVISIAIHPTQRNIIYAATDQGVYRSGDRGESWVPKNQGLGGYGDLVVSGIAIDPNTPTTIYLGTWGYGVFKSANNGDSWSRLTDPLATAAKLSQNVSGNPPPEVRAGGLAYTSADPIPMTTGYRANGAKENLLGEAFQDRDFPSQPQGLPNDLSWTPVRRVAVHPTNPQTLYAAIHNGNGIWRSTNGGNTWSKLGFGSGSGRTVVFANDNTTALATFGDYNGSINENGGVYRTTNGGSSWTSVGTSAVIPRTVVAAAFDPTDPTRMYVGTLGAGIYRSTNNGGTWTPINSGLSDDVIFSVAVSPSNPNVLYAGGYLWVYRSNNGGDSWFIADNNYPAIYSEAVAVDPMNHNIFYAGAQRLGTVLSTGLTPGGFYKSTSGAGDDNLVLKNDGMQDTFVMDITKDPLNANILYASTWASGVFRSTNGGWTWQAINAGITTPYVYSVEAVDSGGSTVLYAATFYTDAGIFKSVDGGDTWTEISAGSALYRVTFDVKSAGSANKLAAATSRGVYWSDDGGQTWTKANGLNEGIVLKIARSPADPNDLAAATYGGNVWTSTNAGHGWTERANGLATPYVYDVVYSPANANIVYGASYGVYRSTNGGSSWSPFGVPTSWIRALDAVGGNHPDVFAGTHDAGVFLSLDGSGKWRPINKGLGDMRIRALTAVTNKNLFAGTNGRSAWKYSVVTRKARAYLPFVLYWTNLPSTLESIADACVLEGYPTINFGTTIDMWAGYDDSLNPDGKTARSFAKFDLSAIPAGTPITRATLNLYLVDSWDFPDRYRTITIHRAGSSWSESSVTWNNKPSIAEAYGSASVIWGGGFWVEFDVTGLVQGWINDAWPNHGLAIRGPEHSGTDSSWRAFNTRESGYVPHIDITYGSQAASESAEPTGRETFSRTVGPTISDLLTGKPQQQQDRAAPAKSLFTVNDNETEE